MHRSLETASLSNPRDFTLRNWVSHISKKRGPAWLDPVWKALIAGALVFALFVAAKNHVMPVLVQWPGAQDTTPLTLIPKVFGLLATLYFMLSLYYALRYEPVEAPADRDLPTCTVIVPAYNEGKMVRVSLLSALANDYPTDKLHVIAVDDGSTDDTWQHIDAVAKQFPGRVTAVRLEKNGGKREALRQGFLLAKGDALVTVDSDSQLEPDALRNIVAPMVKDDRVAAVAGKVLVLNRYANLLTRLLAARFFVTFDLTRAAQSRFGSVLCTPGALSGYRRSAVMEVIEAWSTQTFLGSPCAIGEDRALTTWLLRRGHRSAYQSSGVVHTLMPTKFKGLFRMLLRWERGNVREDLVMLPVLATHWRGKDRWWATLEILLELLQYPVLYASLAVTVKHFVHHPIDMVRLVVTLGVGALIQSLYSLKTERGTDFLYGVGYAAFAFIGLQWIFPYSCLTLRDRRWMTR